MIQITDIEKEYLKLNESETTIQEFEVWIYGNEEQITKESNSELYYDLIQINFNSAEAKHELSKCLKINYDSLFRYRIQSNLIDSLNSNTLEIQDVKYDMLYNIHFLSFSFKIGEMNFIMHNPFDKMNFSQLENTDKETAFFKSFKGERKFLNTLSNALETDKIRIWRPKLTVQIDRITSSKMMRPMKDELKIIIDGTFTFINKEYLKEEMKEVWL